MRKNSFFGISFLVAVAAVFAGVRLLPHARVWLKAHAVVVPFHVMRTYAGAQSGTQITYYGGPVMGGSTNAYRGVKNRLDGHKFAKLPHKTTVFVRTAWRSSPHCFSCLRALPICWPRSL